MGLSCASPSARLVHSHVRFLPRDRDRSRHIRAVTGHPRAVATAVRALLIAHTPTDYPGQERMSARVDSCVAITSLVVQVNDEEQLPPRQETNAALTWDPSLHRHTAHRARSYRRPQAEQPLAIIRYVVLAVPTPPANTAHFEESPLLPWLLPGCAE